jgi:hypothetical protein
VGQGKDAKQAVVRNLGSDALSDYPNVSPTAVCVVIGGWVEQVATSYV